MEDFLTEKGSAKERALVNVTDHVTEKFPPVYLMTCVGDFCRPQAPLLEAALKKNGVYYEFKTYGTEEKSAVSCIPFDHPGAGRTEMQ